MKNVSNFWFIFWLITTSDCLLEDILRKDIFKIRNNIPFSFTHFTLNNFIKINPEDINYYLYTRKYKNVTFNPQLINPKHPIKILIHGWTEHVNVQWYKDIINEYLKRGFYNIIPIDWSSKGDADYLTASGNSKVVGEKIGEFIVFKLIKMKKSKLKNIHLLSHSLGAHVCGFVGRKVYELTGKLIGRITAMDPAAPLFDLIPYEPDLRLSKDDARVVDVIHTDGGMLGFKYPIGSVDFFPNGGFAIQPGCSLLKADLQYDDFFCSHASSHQLFIKSINHKKFFAKSCESYEKYSKGLCKNKKSILFGEDVPINVSGSFYFQTKNTDIIL